MWKEFKEFAVKGNAVDLAVGVIIGAAFGSIVSSLVKDFITLVINFLLVAFCIFLVVRALNKMKRPTDAPPVTKDCPACQMTIPIKATRCPHCTTQLSDSARS